MPKSGVRPMLVVLVALALALAAYAGATRRAPAAGGIDASHARLWIGGDVHFGAHTPTLGGVVARDAIGIVNLEGPTTDDDASASDEERLVNSAARLPALRTDGVRIVGIANNHARDLGPSGILQTARHVRSAGLLPTPAVLETGAGRVVVTAHELGTITAEDLERELSAARRDGAHLIATFHVTGPPSYVPRPELRAAVEAAIGVGARVVAAHGTHAIGPVERRREAVIAWGLGNLLFACTCTREREGALLEVTIAKDGEVRAAIVPVVAGLDGEAPRLDPEADLAFEVLRAIGSSPLRREGPRAFF